MKKYKIIDGHQDISFNSLYITKKDFLKENAFDNSHLMKIPKLNQSDYVRLKNSGVKIIFGVIFPYNIKENKIHDDYELAKKETLKQLNFYNNLEKKNINKIKIIRNKKDLDFVLKKDGILGIVLLLEDAVGVGENLENLKEFHNKGLRMIGPVWNEDNQFGGGTNSTNGLTKKGELLLLEIQKLDMVLDTAHMNEKIFWDSLKIFKGNIMNSHACAYSLNKHKRNLRDKQIRAIASRNGVLGIAFVPEFLVKDHTKAELKDVIKHIDHVVCLCGVDNVAFGSDFDGMSWPQFLPNLAHAGEYKYLVSELKEKYNKKDTLKIIYGNWERFLSNVFK